MLLPDVSLQNFDNRGTLKIDPTLADLPLEDMFTRCNIPTQVLKVQNFYIDPVSGQHFPSEGYSIIDAANGAELGYGMGKDYMPVNYLDALGVFWGDIKNAGGIPTRVISFNKGAKIAVQFMLPQEYTVGDNKHKMFTNYYSSHNGTVGNTFNLSDVRIICGNTFAMSLGDKTLKAVARHTQNVFEKINVIGELFLAAEKRAKLHYDNLESMLLRQTNTIEVNQFIDFMLPKSENEGKRQHAGNDNRRFELKEAIVVSQGERNTNELTFYDVLQGATRFTNYKTQKRDENEQWQYVTGGPGNEFNQKAIQWLNSKK